MTAPGVVHLELHTRELEAARGFYAELCGWHADAVGTPAGPYLSWQLGAVDGGLVACATPRPVWLPYVAVRQVDLVTERARRLGATVLIEPRECPTGWRSVVSTVQGGEVAFWQPKHGPGSASAR
jgi:uncharacterized protein